MLTPGTVVTMRRVLHQHDFDRFAALSGDDNPIHVDPDFAAATRFGRTVSHGMLLYGLIDAALRANMPDSTQLEQQLMFPRPAYAGEEIVVRLELRELDEQSGVGRVATVVTSADGEMVCDGEALLGWNAA